LLKDKIDLQILLRLQSKLDRPLESFEDLQSSQIIYQPLLDTFHPGLALTPELSPLRGSGCRDLALPDVCEQVFLFRSAYLISLLGNFKHKC
jgi:hypothetical protein